MSLDVTISLALQPKKEESKVTHSRIQVSIIVFSVRFAVFSFTHPIVIYKLFSFLGKQIKINGVFTGSDYIRESGNPVKFSLNGFTLPAPTTGSITKTFVVETYFTFEGDEYAIDKHTNFDLTLDNPTVKLDLTVEGTDVAGSTGTLKIVYPLQRDWLPYSWFVISLPKLNRDSAKYATLDLTSIKP